ncbi:MAG: D-2-hydroxyacid dehydrogenase [Sulfurospirillum sp.]
MKIVLLDKDTLGSVDLSQFNQYGDFISYNKSKKKETLNRVKDADIIITNKVVIDEKIMKNCENLKLICIAATGMNNVDLIYAKKLGIEVKNVAGYSTASVAQATFTLLLSLVGGSCYYDDYVKSGLWSKSPIFTNLDREFFEINGKIWGIIGLGNIGKAVANIATAFGANVIYYSTSGVNRNTQFHRKNLDDLLTNSDIISIHAPLNSKTDNLIKKTQLAKMKKGSIILNMGRGGIINEADLAYAIDNFGILAGLDVTKTEPIQSENKLLHVEKKESIIFSPHIAWASKEARKTLVMMIADNIENFLKGEN